MAQVLLYEVLVTFAIVVVDSGILASKVDAPM